MQLSGASRGAVRVAAERAVARGSELVGCADLLAGLADVEGGGARHALGPAAERLRAPSGAASGAVPGAAKTIAFDAEAREAVEAGSRRAVAAERAHVASTDLLDAVLATPSGARALRSAGGDPDAVRAALEHGECCPETVPTYTAAALAELVEGAGALPRRAWVAGFAGQLAVTALLYALVLAIAWDTAGPVARRDGLVGVVVAGRLGLDHRLGAAVTQQGDLLLYVRRVAGRLRRAGVGDDRRGNDARSHRLGHVQSEEQEGDEVEEGGPDHRVAR